MTETTKPRTLEEIVRAARLLVDGPGRLRCDLDAIEALVREAASRASPDAPVAGRTLGEIADDVLTFGWSTMVGPTPEAKAHAVQVIGAALHTVATAPAGRVSPDEGRAVEACRLLVTAAVVEKDPLRFVCPSAFEPAVRAAVAATALRSLPPAANTATKPGGGK